MHSLSTLGVSVYSAAKQTYSKCHEHPVFPVKKRKKIFCWLLLYAVLTAVAIHYVSCDCFTIK